ncbi:MAG: DUF5668 domain-containing protein [candidate division Zixibacteria bacterium]
MSIKYERIFYPRAIIGISLIIIGLLLILSNLGFDTGFHIWEFWPVILIIIGLSMALKKSDSHNSLFGWLFVLIGILILLNNLELMDFGMNLIFPFILLFIGLAILKHGMGSRPKATQDGDHIDITVVLGGGDYKYTSKSLGGGSVFSLMGGAKLNFKEADFSGDSISINVLVLMGGLDIIVPNHWQVVMRGTPILGGMEDKTVSRPSDEADRSNVKRLIIDGTVIMGGIDIKN